MMDISSTGVVLVLATLAVVVLALAAMLFPRKPKRAEKWEKAEIMRQLLALSDKETGARPATPPGRSRPAASRPTATRTPMRPANLPIKANVKTTLPARSKAR